MIFYRILLSHLFPMTIKGRVPPLSLEELGHLPTFMQEKLTPELLSVNNIAVMALSAAVIMVSQSATAWFSN